MENQNSRLRLGALQKRLDQINRSWTKANYEDLLQFYVRVMPGIVAAERCTIFVVDPDSQRIWSRFGTGLAEHEIEAPRADSVVGHVVESGESLIDNSPVGVSVALGDKAGFVTRNLACAPILSLAGYGVTGAIEVLNRVGGEFQDEDLELLAEVAGFLSQALDSIRINDAMLEISNGLNAEVQALRSQGPVLPANFVAESRVMQAVIEMAHTVSETPVNVFIQGDNGTGKEVIARMIHRLSDRADKAFIAVNCASIPENLMESEFFGYEKGAFTGATGARGGRFEEADGGVLFLDEVADLPLMMQPKFLRALQEGEGTRLGSNKLRHYDLRVISATNKDLRKEVEAGRF
ncbi:MAG: sigma 54-interacting transcriptional regulator, partial [Gammaproteobacteria bacterium]|nr:sigma 54-interacting transcriptional regulator [Gammaproteobacteria bacterium]